MHGMAETSMPAFTPLSASAGPPWIDRSSARTAVGTLVGIAGGLSILAPGTVTLRLVGPIEFYTKLGLAEQAARRTMAMTAFDGRALSGVYAVAALPVLALLVGARGQFFGARAGSTAASVGQTSLLQG
jgi:hypothetical protein